MIYKTPDLYLSAYLKAKDYVVSIKRDKGRCFFEFVDVSDDVVNSFYNNAPIGVTAYKNALQDLKSMIYNKG